MNWINCYFIWTFVSNRHLFDTNTCHFNFSVEKIINSRQDLTVVRTTILISDFPSKTELDIQKFKTIIK